MISVLIADDSFLMRTLIGDILRSDPEIRIVGSVSDGQECIDAAKNLKPDVITMDLNMPKVDGLLATRRIMEKSDPQPIVVMVSAFSKDTAHAMLDCLHAGAFDCVRKPSGMVSLDMPKIGAELLSKVKAAARARTDVLKRTGSQPPRKRTAEQATYVSHSGRRYLIVIGASTGGPPVLEEIFSLLPDNLNASILVAQHMPEPFTASLAERLDRVSHLTVREAIHHEVLETNTALIVPGDSNMELIKKDGKLVTCLIPEPMASGLRPSIDILMESAARQSSDPLIGVLLTGMGNDGDAGMCEIKKHGGHTLVQAPDTCVVDSMVQGVIDRNCADEQLSPAAIVERIVFLTQT